MYIKKEDIVVGNVCAVANIDKNILEEERQCFSPEGSAPDIKQETEIKPIVLLDSTNGVFIQEDQYLNVRIRSKRKMKSKCKFCDTIFENRADLNYHLADQHPFKCEICLTKLRSKQSLKRHLEAHSDKYRFECHICTKKFKRKENLKGHLVTHSNRYDFKCNICDLKLRHRSCLRKHLITHLATRRFECHTCRATFKRKDALTRHLKKKYKCNFCGCEFACRGGLKYHKASHGKDKGLFNCVICLTNLKTKQSLDQHLERHLYIYDFECSICDKKFRQEEKLNQHLVKHSTVGTLECHICRAPFARKDSLKFHVNRHSNKPNENKRHKKELVIVLYDCLTQSKPY